jgi:hypothetical protein
MRKDSEIKVKRKEFNRLVRENRRLHQVAQTRIRLHMVGGMAGEPIEAGATLMDMSLEQLSLAALFAADRDPLEIIQGPLILMVAAPEPSGFELMLTGKYGGSHR